RTLGLRNRLAEDRMRLAHRLDVVAGIAERAVIAAAAEELLARSDRELLDLGDPPVDDLQTDRNRDEVAFTVVRVSVCHVLDDRADERDLLGFDVRHVELVRADPGHAVPESLAAERQADAVLGELDLAREELRIDVVLEHRLEIPIDVILE